MTDIITLLKEKIDTKDILENELMNKHTSFKVGGKADIFVKAHDIEQIKHVLKVSKENNIPLFILGNGSNIIVRDKGIRGITLKIDLKKIEIEKQEENVIVNVGAGNKLAEVAIKLLKEEISGFEFASGIPGTIGGFIKMNAGAYGKEAKDIVLETTIMDYDGNIEKIKGEQHKFEYRKSIFSKLKVIILETKLKLNYGSKEEIHNLMDEYAKARIEKQPLNFPNAGSTFKRGKDFITAKLIDECGLKGYSIGGAKVSTKHAGFIVNTGEATAKDILALVEYVKKIIFEKTQRTIELEVEVVGEE